MVAGRKDRELFQLAAGGPASRHTRIFTASGLARALRIGTIRAPGKSGRLQMVAVCKDLDRRGDGQYGLFPANRIRFNLMKQRENQ